MSPQQGKVNIHAISIPFNELLFSFLGYPESPAPTTAAVAVWVVLTGTPPSDAAIIQATAAISAAKPRSGVNSTVSSPTFFIILYPPTEVPSEIITAHRRTNHSGAFEAISFSW